MADIIKNVFKYGELRRTIFLNAHNKDDYGRHRGQVLYGMNLAGSGTVLTVAPGALYTSQGQRLFFDATDGEIDIGPATVDAFGAAAKTNYPICVMIYLGYQFDTARVAKGIDVNTAVGQQALFTLTGRVAPFDLNTAAPTYNLLPRDPVYLDTFQPPTYTSLQNWNGPAVSAPPAVNKQNTSIQFGEIPLGYAMIGVNPSNGAFPSSLTSPGVSIVSYGNAFDMISELIGQDVLVPLQPTDVSAALVQPVTGTALRQGYSAKIVGANTAPTLVRPAYGTPAAGPSGNRSDSSFSTYRQPNFLKDGVPLLEALRRLDVILRQWLNFTGKQDLVSITQDGGSLPLQATLDQILQKFDGGLSAPTNLNAAVWPNNAVGPDPANHVLKEGLIVHLENTLLGKLGTTEGDSVRSALSALDVALHLILTSVLGENIPRSQLRDASGASYTPFDRDERPEGGTPLARPTVGGTAVDIYQTTQLLRSVVTEALARTLSGPGTNWLANYGFWAGDTDAGNETTPPQFWSISGLGTWARSEHTSGGRTGKLLTVALQTGSAFDQHIVDAAADNYLGTALRSASHLSFSAVIQNTSAQGIRIEVSGYSDVAGTIGVFSVTSALIPQGAAARVVTATWAIGPTDVINHLRFRIVSDNPLVACSFAIAGAAFNAGMPISVAQLCTLPSDFVSRDGGAQKPMRGPLYMGAKQAKDAANATDPQDLTTLSQVTAAILVETNNRIADVNAEEARGLAAEAVLQANIVSEQNRAIAAEATKQDNAIYDGSAYYATGATTRTGNSVKLVVAGVDRFVPSWPTASGPCHSNCHSNCNHSDCGRGSW